MNWNTLLFPFRRVRVGAYITIFHDDLQLARFFICEGLVVFDHIWMIQRCQDSDLILCLHIPSISVLFSYPTPQATALVRTFDYRLDYWCLFSHDQERQARKQTVQTASARVDITELQDLANGFWDMDVHMIHVMHLWHRLMDWTFPYLAICRHGVYLCISCEYQFM